MVAVFGQVRAQHGGASKKHVTQPGSRPVTLHVYQDSNATVQAIVGGHLGDAQKGDVSETDLP